MVIKIPSIYVDELNITDISLTIPKGKNQLRLKLSIPENNLDIDLVIINYTFAISGIGIAIDKIVGEERISKKSFSGKIDFHLLSKTWKLTAKYGSREISLKDTDISKLICQFFNIVRK